MFDFDPAKSVTNKAKHGIDFEEAQALWLDDERIESESFRSVDERRWLVIGRIEEKAWTAIVAYRLGTIRIISVRRLRANEEESYERRKKH